MKIISSQHYRDEEIVEAKLASGDFEVLVSPAFEVGGELVAVVIDGHHSLAAAQAAGVEPTLVEATVQDDDRIALIGQDPELFLEAMWMDGDYYDVDTGVSVW